MRLVPAEVLDDARERAASAVQEELPASRGLTAAIVATRLLLAALAIALLYRLLGRA